jgi:hypothetical protein
LDENLLVSVKQKHQKRKVVAIKTYKPSIEEKMELTKFIVTKLEEDGL